MGYVEIIKEGYRVANKNLAVILTHFVSGVALAAVFFVCLAVFLAMAIGSIAQVDLQDLSPDQIASVIQSSLSLVVVLVLLALLFTLSALLITSYVRAGNLGCIIDTARGVEAGFTAKNFFAAARRSVFSMFGLYVLWGLMFLGVCLAFLLVGGLSVWGILMPMADAGRKVMAFAVGVPLFVVLILAFMAIVFFFYAGWAFSAIILVGGRSGAAEATGAAGGFLKRHFWDSFLFTLLIAALVIGVGVAVELVNLPFRLMSEANPLFALGLLPLVLVGSLFQMYAALVARCSYVVYFIDRASPETPPEATGPAGMSANGEGLS